MSDNAHHIVPIKTNLLVFATLLCLTAVTVWVAQLDFGIMNIVVAMLVASVKAVLVFLWFMHLRYDSWANRVILFTGVFFAIIFYALTAVDVFTR